MTPDTRTHEQRILAMQVDSYKVLCDIREHLMCIEHELRKPPMDMEEIRDLIKSIDAQAKVIGAKFIPDPDKIAAFTKPKARK